MNVKSFTLLLLCLSYAISLDCEGADKYTKSCPPTATPVWPDQFEQTFEETFTYPVLGERKTSGKFFYDWLSKSYRINRENGHYDRYCGPVYPFSDTACSQIVVKGDRYLYYPEKNYCCYCCSSEHGCGILKPDWVAGAQFEDYVTENDVILEKWNRAGFQNNYYYANAKDRVMKKIDQQPNDLQVYDTSSFKNTISDPSVFNLPGICKKESACPIATFCTALRSFSKAKFLQK